MRLRRRCYAQSAAQNNCDTDTTYLVIATGHISSSSSFHGLPCPQHASNSHRVRIRDARVTMHGAQSTFPDGLLPSKRVSPSPRCHSPFSPMVRWPQGALGIPVHTAPHTRPTVWKECVYGVMLLGRAQAKLTTHSLKQLHRHTCARCRQMHLFLNLVLRPICIPQLAKARNALTMFFRQSTTTCNFATCMEHPA